MENRKLATFAAGCFWGVEETFRLTPGVKDTKVGYIGGATDNPDYRSECTGQTFHAEAVQVEYEPEEVSFARLLEPGDAGAPSTPFRGR